MYSGPHAISVISGDDIAKSSSGSVADLLSREANLNLQSFYGSDKKATVDLRGMGDTAASNVLILVDGVRLNEMDLSGADLTAIPLSQIRRVEILRGGGSVMYGDGAVGGVINIITVAHVPDRPRATLDFARGSYGTEDYRLASSIGNGPLKFKLNLSQYDSDGFRRNGDLHSRNAAAEIRLLAPAGLTFLDTYLRVRKHHDEYGFPGPVSAEDFASGTGARRATKTPFDRGETDDTVYTFGARTDFGRFGRLEFQSTWRDHENPYIIGYTELLTRDEQLSTITSRTHDQRLTYSNGIPAFGQEHELRLGIDRRTGNYARYSGGRYIEDASEQKLGKIASRGLFSSLTLRPAGNLAINMGIRTDRFSSRLSDEKYTNTCDFDASWNLQCTPYAYVPQNQREAVWHNKGSELGVTWTPLPILSAYASVTRTFRNPNIDELVLAASDLRPQSGRTTEAGVRLQAGEAWQVSFGVFRIHNRDEIYYGADPSSHTSANRNYELPTQRTGSEFEARWRPIPALSLKLNMGYVRPRFVGTDADIPHVPRKTANANIAWQLTDTLGWSLSTRYVGQRYDGNDFSNRTEPALPSYTIWDTALRFKLDKAELSAGINNLTNRAYSTLGYSSTYYPMPERNAYVRLHIEL